MSILEWKKFNFFRLIPFADQKIKGSLNSKVTSFVSNSVYKILCDDIGCVHVFYRSWESISFYANNTAIYLCAHSSETNFLITLSNADCESGVILKVWDLNKLTKRNGAPCVGTAVIASRCIATALNVCHQNSIYFIAIGFEKGEISIFRGQVNREFSIGFRSFAASSLRITGIEFSQKNSKCMNMFVCSDAGIFCYSVAENNEVKDTKFVLDTKKDTAPCCAMQPFGNAADSYFIVGRYDAIYCYTSDGRGPCYAIEGEKKKIAWFGNNIIVAIHPASSSFTNQRENLIIIIDISHKMIVFNKTIDIIRGFLIDKKSCSILTDKNEVLAVLEKGINNKLELLANKHMYDIALRLVTHEECDEKEIAHVYKLYGDYLYKKNDFEAAIEKYIKTIGQLEPYYIIRKFLGSKLARYLSEYLNALLKTDFATEEHVELFINCNSRMNLPQKIDEFIYEINGLDKGKDTLKDIFCNISEAMVSRTIVRQSDTNAICDASLSGLLRVINNQDKIKEFLRPFGSFEIHKFFAEHGQTLTKYYARQTTEILKSFCNDKFRTYPEKFIPLFVNHPTYCIDFLEHVIQNCSDLKSIVFNYLFELYLRSWNCKETDSQKLCEFLEFYDKHYIREEILMKCKNYKFWDGVLYFYKTKHIDNLSIRYFIRNGDLKNICNLYHSNRNSEKKLSIQPFGDNEIRSEGSITLLQYILTENINNVLQSPLQILQSIAQMNTFLLGDVKEFYLHEHLRNTGNIEKQANIVLNLIITLQQLNKLLHSYLSKPVEVRHNVCGICKQQLSNPTVHFLCQHAFHIHCLTIYSEDGQNCVACNANKDKLVLRPADIFKENSLLLHSNDFILLIKRYLQRRLFNENVFNSLKNAKDILNSEVWENDLKLSPVNKNKLEGKSTNPFEVEDFISKNPFDQYDANLNPFEE